MVECPLCLGCGYMIFNAASGMRATLTTRADYLRQLHCPLCDGSGEIDEKTAAEWEVKDLEEDSHVA